MWNIVGVAKLDNQRLEKETTSYLGVILSMVRDNGTSDSKENIEPNCTEKVLIKTTEEVESGNKLDTQLLEDKSHEIRTYMTRIISMTDLTLMTELTKEQRDYLTIVKSSTRSLLNVLNEIVDYSKKINS